MICQLKRTDGLTVAKEALIADSFFLRAKGLMFAKDLNPYDAMLITPCNSIHTFFMNFDLDVVFLNKKNHVVKIIRHLKPWRMTRPYFKASQVLELKAGTLALDLKEGDQLERVCIN